MLHEQRKENRPWAALHVLEGSDWISGRRLRNQSGKGGDTVTSGSDEIHRLQ